MTSTEHVYKNLSLLYIHGMYISSLQKATKKVYNDYCLVAENVLLDYELCQENAQEKQKSFEKLEQKCKATGFKTLLLLIKLDELETIKQSARYAAEVKCMRDNFEEKQQEMEAIRLQQMRIDRKK